MADQGQGRRGDSQGHAEAGSQSSGNPNAAENLTNEDRSKGGRSQGKQNNPGNFANRPQEDVEEAARKGGQS